MSVKETDFHRALLCDGHELPGIWRYLLPDDWQHCLKLPQEHRATCHPCHNVLVGEYRDDCRCCTYFPQLPNFLLGFAMENQRSRQVVRQLIAQGHTLPMGLMAAPVRFGEAVAAAAQDRFGQEPRLRCPFVATEDFSCQIYPYRNSICATFFCTSDCGATGAAYWQKFQEMVGRIETALSHWAMDQVGLSSDGCLARLDGLAGDVARLTEPNDRGWQEWARQRIWGQWFGREIEFFEHCAAVVAEHRQQLYEIACRQKWLEPMGYEAAVRQWIPAQYRDACPAVSAPGAQPKSIAELWYLMQLSHRKLWHLPFGDGPLFFNTQFAIESNRQNRPLCRAWRNRPFLIRKSANSVAKQPVDRFLSAGEAAILRRFEAGQELGETLLESEAARAVEDIRAFLAECLRYGILVPQSVRETQAQ